MNQARSAPLLQGALALVTLSSYDVDNLIDTPGSE